jgi:peptide/nickel transport system ATP-binding protein
VSVQAEILSLLRELQERRGTALLFITHDMGVVAEIADLIVVMRHGKVVEEGEVRDVFASPQHRYTQQLLESVRRLDQPSPRRLDMRIRKELGAPVLVSRGLTKHFGTEAAVKQVDLQLLKGENLGVVGESGSGKTTMGRCLQRLYDVTSGRVAYVDRGGVERDITDLTDRELREPWRDIRTVFQDPFGSLNPRMTVGQIIAEPLAVRGGMSGALIRERVSELLDLVGLPASAANRYPHAFSGGQRQRISIARAIAPDPRIIIADEATSALDVKMRAQILDLMLDLQERLDLSYILISHDLSVIRYFCDRVAVMYRGEIVETGPTEEVCSNPQHPYTQALLSAVPVADPALRGTRQRIRYIPEARA